MTRSTHFSFVALALAVAALAAPAAQTTASISGVVVTTSTPPEPVRRAIVTIAPDIQGVVTDDAGRFSFRNLTAGTYHLNVSKVAYLKTEYGAPRPGVAGTPISLTIGQQVAGVTIRLARGAVISGVVRDVDGEPAANLQVSATGASAPAAAMTDDRGEYRIFGMAPGEYTVFATPPRFLTGAMDVPSTSENNAALAQLRGRNGRGTSAADGRGGAQTGANASVTAASSSPRPSYAPVYYPGTTDQSRASKITLAEGEERACVGFALVLTGMTEITGVVTNPDGSARAGAQIGASTSSARTVSSIGATSDAQGRFRLANVAPGHYTVTVRVLPSLPNTPLTGPPPLELRTTRLWARAEIDVAGTAPPSLALQLQPAMALSGRLVFDAASLPRPANLAAVTIGLKFGPVPQTPAPAPPGQVRPDGTFVIGGITPGFYQFTTTIPGVEFTPGSGWWLRSAMLDGRDLLDGPIEFNATTGDVSNVVVTYTDRHTQLAGTLSSAVGTAAPDYLVIAFPADRALWTIGSRRVKMTRPATNGRFAIPDLPPGTYRLAAVTDLDVDVLGRSDFLESLIPAAVAVTLGEAETRTQDLRILSAAR